MFNESNALSSSAKSSPLTVPPGADEELQAEVGRFNALQSKLTLTDIRGDLAALDTTVTGLPAKVADLRRRSYVFKSQLEKTVETLAAQWRNLRPGVDSTLQNQMPGLEREALAVQSTLSRGAKSGVALSMLEGAVDAALNALHAMYGPLQETVQQTQAQVDDVAWTLQQSEQASFGFLAAEAPVEAVPANWKKAGDKDGVNGVLYLTDQRVIFEQKEDVATKRVLFVATAKQKVQNLLWAVAASDIQKAVGSKRGFLGKDDYLSLTTTSGQPFATTEVHLKGETGEAWQGFIGRVKSGDIANERTTPVDQKVVETLANAPTKCPVCGATFAKPIVRGQTEVTCDYCGSKTRL
jgi:hypothetical protein